ncbi:MAG: sulfite exporter TauE/SafE family protein [Gammaproteobacteria bacterium]|nr:sulfite exporter TauE/SafE family protein [Gammaproteobacteria bacterium]
MKYPIQAIQDVVLLLEPYAVNPRVQQWIGMFARLQILAVPNKVDNLRIKALHDADVLAEEMRTLLRAEMLTESISDLNKSYFDAIFAAQILLATYWPSNGREENGCLSDPLLNHDFFAPDLEVIAVSAGHLYEKAELSEYYARGMGKDIDGTNKAIIITPMRETLTSRDIAYLRKKGVSVPSSDVIAVDTPAPVDEENVQAANRHLPGANNNRAPQEGLVPHRNINVFRFVWQVLRSLYHRDGQEGQIVEELLDEGPMVGFTFGFIVGMIGGGSALILLVSVCLPILVLPGSIAVASLGVVAGMSSLNEIRAEANDERLLENISRVTVAMGIAICIGALGVGLLSFSLPYVLAALTSYSVISAATAAAVVANLAFVQIVMPAVLFLVGAVKECFKAGAMINFYSTCFLMLAAIPAAILGTVGGGLGVIASLLVPNRPQPPRAPRNPEDPLVDNADNHNPLVHANRGNGPLLRPGVLAEPNQAAIFRRLSIDRNNDIAEPAQEAKGDQEQEKAPPSPRTMAEINAAIAAADKAEFDLADANADLDEVPARGLRQ